MYFSNLGWQCANIRRPNIKFEKTEVFRKVYMS